MFFLRFGAFTRASSHVLFLLLLATGLLFVCAPGASAQGVGSSRGPATAAGESNVIQGKVFFPGTPPANKRVKVKLDSANALGGSTQTDDDGAFRFNGLAAGQYSIVVEAGPDYDVAVENISIDREASLNGARIVQVPIYLKSKGATAAAFAGVPQPAVDVFNKAMQSSNSGNTKKAVEQLTSAIGLAPNFGLAHAELGAAYLKLSQPDKAVEALTKAVELQPKEAVPHLNLGIALFNQNKFDTAEPELRRALELNTALATGHYYLGMTLLKQKKYDEAEKELETAVRSGGDNIPQAHRYLGGLYASHGKNKEAADELEKYLKLDPKAADAERAKAMIKDLRSKK
jgi:tetratricopeptide (TPR) repeat protein